MCLRMSRSVSEASLRRSLRKHIMRMPTMSLSTTSTKATTKTFVCWTSSSKQMYTQVMYMYCPATFFLFCVVILLCFSCNRKLHVGLFSNVIQDVYKLNVLQHLQQAPACISIFVSCSLYIATHKQMRVYQAPSHRAAQKWDPFSYQSAVLYPPGGGGGWYCWSRYMYGPCFDFAKLLAELWPDAMRVGQPFVETP